MSRRTLSAICLLVAAWLPMAGSIAQANDLHRKHYAPIDGDRGSHRENAAGTELRRSLASDYADAVASLAAPLRPSARAVSNAVLAQQGSPQPYQDASDYLWQWGQFVDHDIDLTGPAEPLELADIPVPSGDPDFDPFHTGTAIIPLDRSVYEPGSVPRQQLNQITGWMDASMIYGSDAVRAAALRTLDGTGRLATSDGDLLPWNDAGLPNAGGGGPDLFLAGDVRANEQVALTAMHTLFVREHNRLARKLARRHRHWSGERLYQEARRVVIAEIQTITYGEFLPALLGRRALPRYQGHRSRVDARIANVFSTAAYRFGHSALSPTLLRIGAGGAPIPEGHLSLRDAFFRPDRLVNEGGIEPVLRGLAAQRCQKVDAFVVDDVRNFLFGPPGAGGFDLAALNIQRGRDHGLPSYNAARQAMGRRPARSFADVSRDPDVQARLAAAYDHVDDVDLWVGGLAEGRLRNSHLGPLFQRIVVEQFTALRDGDRHHFERVFRGRDRQALRRLRLSHVIRWNTDIGRELPHDVFHVR